MRNFQQQTVCISGRRLHMSKYNSSPWRGLLLNVTQVFVI